MITTNLWLVVACGLALALVPCAWVCVRGKTMDRLVAVEMASLVVTLTTVLLAEGYGRPSLYDLALALSLLAYPSALVFAHFLEQWL